MSENEHEAKMAHPRMAAGALFSDEAGRVLLVEPSYKDYRDIPGGYVEQGESPRQACVREVHEELGIQPHIGRLLVVDWAPNPGEGDKVLYLFDGGRLDADHRQQIALQADELRGYDFHCVEQVPDLTIPRLARRIAAGIQARMNGLTAYLEHGQSPETGTWPHLRFGERAGQSGPPLGLGIPTRRGPSYMGRTEYYNAPSAPRANTLIPASNLLVVDDDGAILLQRRRDTGQWALPGGAQDIGETAAQCAVRECMEETGIIAEIVDFLGIYTNPRHIVAYTDGEIRQQYENTYIGRLVGGEPTINDEADGVRFVQPAELDQYDIHPSMRQQIGDYLAGTYPYLG